MEYVRSSINVSIDRFAAAIVDPLCVEGLDGLASFIIPRISHQLVDSRCTS